MEEYEGETPIDERFKEEILQNYSEGDTEFERTMIESYKLSVGEHLPKLREALEADDQPNSVLHSHDIKGSSGYIGTNTIRFITGKMEKLCREGSLSTAAENLAELESEVKETFKLLDTYLDNNCKEDFGDEEEELDTKKEESTTTKEKITTKDSKSPKD